MTVPARLAAFVLVLAVLFAGGWAVGAAVGPLGREDVPPPASTDGEPGGHGGHEGPGS